MQRWVRGLPVVLIGILAATATATTTESTAAAAGAAMVARGPAPVAVASSSGDLEARLSGERTIVVDPGASVRRSFVITNRSTNLRLTVQLTAVDATAQTDGQFRYEDDASPTGPASWLTLSDVVATLEPGATARGSFTVSPPADADPGDVVAGVVVRIDHAVRVADNHEVRSRESVSLPVAIQVKGAATTLVSIDRVAVVKDNGHEYLEIAFQNTGATANAMVGQVNVLGAHPRSVEVHAVVAALTHTSARVPFAMPDGAKTVPVSVETQDAGGDRASWSGVVGPTSAGAASAAPDPSQPMPHAAAASVGAHGASIPWAAPILVGLLFLAAAIWLVAELRRSRRRRVAMILASAESGVFAPAAPAMYAPDEMWPQHVGALTSKLDTLVDAIDRLVVRLGESAPLPVGPTVTPVATPTVAAVPVPEIAEPQSPASPRTPAETGAILYTPAAASAVDESSAAAPDSADGEYPYDWPSQAQLEQFEARQHATRQDRS